MSTCCGSRAPQRDRATDSVGGQQAWRAGARGAELGLKLGPRLASTRSYSSPSRSRSRSLYAVHARRVPSSSSRSCARSGAVVVTSPPSRGLVLPILPGVPVIETDATASAAILLACRPIRRVSRVCDVARAADCHDRVPRRGHRDERSGRRCVRDDRGRRGARRRGRAARPVVFARALQPAAGTGHSAVHRDHAGDDGRRSRPRGGPAAARGAAPREGAGGAQRAVRPARAPPRVRADRPRLAEPARAVHRRARAQAAAAPAPAWVVRPGGCARDRGADRAPGARRRGDVRPRPVRAVPAAVRERGDDRRCAWRSGSRIAGAPPAASAARRR